MKTVKYRLDFSAHASIVVEVPDTENSEEKAIEIAEKYMSGRDVYADWEMDDGGIEEVENPENYEPVNDVKLEF